MQGLRYGVAIWVIATVSYYMIYYAVQPWPATVVAAQIGLELVSTLLLSVVLAGMCRKPVRNDRSSRCESTADGTALSHNIPTAFGLGQRKVSGDT